MKRLGLFVALLALVGFVAGCSEESPKPKTKVPAAGKVDTGKTETKNLDMKKTEPAAKIDTKETQALPPLPPLPPNDEKKGPDEKKAGDEKKAIPDTKPAEEKNPAVVEKKAVTEEKKADAKTDEPKADIKILEPKSDDKKADDQEVTWNRSQTRRVSKRRSENRPRYSGRTNRIRTRSAGSSAGRLPPCRSTWPG